MSEVALLSADPIRGSDREARKRKEPAGERAIRRQRGHGDCGGDRVVRLRGPGLPRDCYAADLPRRGRAVLPPRLRRRPGRAVQCVPLTLFRCCRIDRPADGGRDHDLPLGLHGGV